MKPYAEFTEWHLFSSRLRVGERGHDLDDTFIYFKSLIDTLKENKILEFPTLENILYMKMVETMLDFIRASRDGNWSLHLDSFATMIPWMTIYDHTNYARWGAIYIQ